MTAFDRNSKAFKDMCARFGVSETLVAALVTVESNWNPLAWRYEPAFTFAFKAKEFATRHGISLSTEAAGQRVSYGMLQVMGCTARELGFVDTFPQMFVDPMCGLEYGIRYLVTRMDRYSNVEDAIAAYNAGSARRDPLTGKFINQQYVNKVLQWI